MGTDEIGNELLPQVLLTVDAVEEPLELLKLTEGRLAHEHEHAVAGMLRSHLQATADVVADELAGVLFRRAVGGFVVTSI